MIFVMSMMIWIRSSMAKGKVLLRLQRGRRKCCLVGRRGVRLILKGEGEEGNGDGEDG